MSSRNVSRRLTPDQWRMVEAQYHDLWRAWEALMKTIEGRVRERTRSGTSELRIAFWKTGVRLESEAIHQLGEQRAARFAPKPPRPKLVPRRSAPVTEISGRIP